jgi:hypothetical protein
LELISVKTFFSVTPGIAAMRFITSFSIVVAARLRTWLLKWLWISGISPTSLKSTVVLSRALQPFTAQSQDL